MDVTARFRELLLQLGRGVRVLDPLFDEALRLLDEHEDELKPEQVAALEDVRFLFSEAIETRDPGDRKRVVARIVARDLAAGSPRETEQRISRHHRQAISRGRGPS
jgi:hypothetical protein